MSRSRIPVTVVCEDKQQAAFVRRFFKKRNIRIYTVTNTSGGAGDQFVRESYPKQLDAVRTQGGGLVAMIDGDRYDLGERHKQMDEACTQTGIAPRAPGDNVAVLVPRRNIETWFAYLEGEEVDETTEYPKLGFERECRRHVDALWEMCSKDQKLRLPSPVSLQAACEEYRNLRL